MFGVKPDLTSAENRDSLCGNSRLKSLPNPGGLTRSLLCSRTYFAGFLQHIIPLLYHLFHLLYPFLDTIQSAGYKV